MTDVTDMQPFLQHAFYTNQFTDAKHSLEDEEMKRHLTKVTGTEYDPATSFMTDLCIYLGTFSDSEKKQVAEQYIKTNNVDALAKLVHRLGQHDLDSIDENILAFDFFSHLGVLRMVCFTKELENDTIDWVQFKNLLVGEWNDINAFVSQKIGLIQKGKTKTIFTRLYKSI